MAGHVRERKRWQLQDGPHGTLRRLRNQLAEDGCADSQLVIAKHLLEEAQESDDWKEKEVEAVNWLLKASEQNSEQATKLLSECFHQNKGLTGENYDKVYRYLTMSQQEKLSRIAAKDLYEKLAPAGIITSKKLMATLNKSKKIEKMCDDQLKNDNILEEQYKKDEMEECSDSARLTLNCGGVVYTEDDLLDLASKMATGQCLDQPVDWEEQCERVNNLPLREKFKDPWSCYCIAYIQMMDYISKNGPQIILSLITPNRFHVIIMLIVNYLSTPCLALSSIPIVLFYISLISMVVTTFQMLHLQKCLKSFQCWASIFSLPPENSDQMECLFLWNHGSAPYMQYFVSLISLLFTYPLTPPKFIACSELTVLSSIMAVMTFVGIGKAHDWFVMSTVFMHLLLLVFPSVYLSLPVSSYVGDWMFCAGYINLSHYIRLHVGFPGLFFLVAPVLFVLMAMKKKNCVYGLHRVVLPHFVCIYWWQMAATFFSTASVIGLIRGTLLIGGTFVCLPYIFTILVTSLVLWMFFSCFCKSNVFFYFLVSIFPTCLQNFGGRVFKCNRQFERSVICVKVLCYFIVVVYLYCGICVSDLQEMEKSEPLVEFQHYYKFCHQPAWEPGCLAQVQYECRHLKGSKISWQGTVVRVSITDTKNELEQILDLLPTCMASKLKCLIGFPYLDYCSQCDLRALLHALKQDECHLVAWDVHKFEIVACVKTESDTADVFVEAEDFFKPFLLRLQRNDVVIFNGTLTDGLGSARPVITLDGIECVSCINENKPFVRTREKLLDFSESFKAIIHFIFSPVIEYIK